MRTLPMIAALSALMLVAGPVTHARTTRVFVRLVELVRSSTVMVVSPTRINAPQQRDGSITTTWHVFRVEETLSTATNPKGAGRGRQLCSDMRAPGLVATHGEVVLPILEVDEREPSYKLEMGRRYVLMATGCGDGTSRFSIGSGGLFEIDAAGNLATPHPPDDFERESLTSVKEMIADIRRYDADGTHSGVIVGQVLDAVNNRPVGEAQVRLSGVDEREVQSTDDGWFVFRDVRAFTYNLSVNGSGWMAAKQRVRIDAGQRRGALSVSLHRLPGIHGVLREENGRPIPMVWLNAAQLTIGDVAASNSTFRQARTDDLGRFSFDALPPGEYLVQAPIHALAEAEPDERSGLTFYPSSFYSTGDALVDATPVSIRSDEGSREIEIVVRALPMRRVTGVVRRGRVPAVGAYVEVRRVDVIAASADAAKLAVRGVRTKSDGTFLVSDLAPGEYVLTLIGEEVRAPLAAHVDVKGGAIAGVTFDAQAMTVARASAESATTSGPTARIDGVVTDADSSDAAFLARARVTVTNVETRAVRKVQTDPRGSFHVGRLAAGRYEVVAEREGFLPVTQGTVLHVPAVVTVGDGGAAFATLSMRPAGVVSGAVYDQSGKPLAGYHVTLRKLSMENGALAMHDLLREFKIIGGVHNAGVTDDEGRYRIFGVPTGEYLVAAVLERNVSTTHRTTREEVERALADVRTTPGSDRPGFVAPPVPSAPPSASPAVTRGRLPVYHPGTVNPLSAARVRVEAGTELAGVDIAFIDAAPVPVSGLVRFEGADIGGTVRILLRFERVDLGGGLMPNGYVDDKRSFTAQSVPPGRYVISARTQTGANASESSMSGRAVIDVGDAPVEGVVVTLRPAGAVSGRLVAPAGASLGSRPIVVRLEPLIQSDGDIGSSVRAAADGAFSLESVTPGRYRIRLESGDSDAIPWTLQGMGLPGGQLTDDVFEVPAGPRVAITVPLRTR